MRNVLITGGSEGIGFEIARCYAADGAHAVLAARTESRLQEACGRLRDEFGVPADCCTVDLAEAGGPARLYREVTDRFGEMDVLINNAGIGFAGGSLSIPLEADEKLIALNDTAAVSLCKLFGRQMADRHAGQIINLGSTGAFQPGPWIASYYASKAFIVSYSQALAVELRSSGVRVQCFCPGPVDTRFYEKSGGVRPGMDLMTPQSAARWLYAHRDSGKVVLVPGVLNQLALALPAGLRMRIVALLKERNAGKDDK